MRKAGSPADARYAGLWAGLLGWWAADTQGLLRDWSRQGRDALPSGSVPSWSGGPWGPSCSFNGSLAMVSPWTPPSPGNCLTVAWSLCPTNTNETYIGAGAAGGTTGWTLWITNSLGQMYVANGTTYQRWRVGAGFAPAAGVWSHHVFTVNLSGSGIGYKNGLFVASAASTISGPIAAAAQSFILGSSNGSVNKYTGLLGPVGVWNRQLSPAEVYALYRGVTPTDPRPDDGASVDATLIGAGALSGACRHSRIIGGGVI